MESGDIIEQKCWQYIRDVNDGSDESLDRIALTDCRRDYTYRRMNGKVDVRRINEVTISGSAYSIEGTYKDGRLKAIEMEPCDMRPDNPGCECFAVRR